MDMRKIGPRQTDNLQPPVESDFLKGDLEGNWSHLSLFGRKVGWRGRKRREKADNFHLLNLDL